MRTGTVIACDNQATLMSEDLQSSVQAAVVWQSADLTSSLVLTFPDLMSSLMASTIFSAVLGPKSALCIHELPYLSIGMSAQGSQ